VALEWVSCLPTALGFQLWEAEISVCRRFLAALTLANCLIYALSITVTEQNCSLGGSKQRKEFGIVAATVGLGCVS
jgi:hypothetical protein